MLLGAVEPLELRQGEAFLELDRAAGHGRTGIYTPLYGPKVAAAERAGQSSAIMNKPLNTSNRSTKVHPRKNSRNLHRVPEGVNTLISSHC